MVNRLGIRRQLLSYLKELPELGTEHTEKKSRGKAVPVLN
jgi:hypothetical protein